MCDPQHEQHFDLIVDFITGLQEVNASMSNLREKFKDYAEKIEVCAEILKEDTYSLEEYIKRLTGKCEDVEAILNQMKQQLKLITDLHQPLRDSHRAIITHPSDVQKQITEINNMQEDSNAIFIRKIKKLSQKL